jgi:hypothetical protein
MFQIWPHQIWSTATAGQEAPLPPAKVVGTQPKPKLQLPDLPSTALDWHRRREGFGSTGARESSTLYCSEERDEECPVSLYRIGGRESGIIYMETGNVTSKKRRWCWTNQLSVCMFTLQTTLFRCADN